MGQVKWDFLRTSVRACTIDRITFSAPFGIFYVRMEIWKEFFQRFVSKFRFHIKDSKWGRKCIFINCKSCNGSPQQISFQFANGKLPHSRCRVFGAMCDWDFIWYKSTTSMNWHLKKKILKNQFSMGNCRRKRHWQMNYFAPLRKLMDLI